MYKINLFLFLVLFFKLISAQLTGIITPTYRPTRVTKIDIKCSFKFRNGIRTVNSVYKPYINFEDCKKECLNSNDTCKFGFDWDKWNKEKKYCWFSTTNQFYADDNVDHFYYPCPMTTIRPMAWSSKLPTSPLTPTSTKFKKFSKAKTNGHIASPSDTLDQCKHSCLKIEMCEFGFDYFEEGEEGRKCFISTNLVLVYDSAYDHYQPIKENFNTNSDSNSGSLLFKGSFYIMVVVLKLLLLI